ncbi:MAG: hypothetical protein SFX73_25575 [Kofleriaceae bacterium]|nr:hypothetical protein [Kofleriaceae bacterium]
MPRSGTGTSLVPVRTVHVAGTSASFEPALFEPGATYVAEVSTRLTFPDAVGGDWSTISLPIENVTMFSTTFTVTN